MEIWHYSSSLAFLAVFGVLASLVEYKDFWHMFPFSVHCLVRQSTHIHMSVYGGLWDVFSFFPREGALGILRSFLVSPLMEAVGAHTEVSSPGDDFFVAYVHRDTGPNLVPSERLVINHPLDHNWGCASSMFFVQLNPPFRDQNVSFTEHFVANPATMFTKKREGHSAEMQEKTQKYNRIESTKNALSAYSNAG